MTPTPTAAARVSGTIKALEWTEGTFDDGRRKWTTDGEQITESHPSWPVDHQGFYLFHAGVALATIGEAKDHAQLRQNDRILAAIQPDPEPSARDALQVIADIPSTMNGSFDHGLEVAYRAVEALFDKPPMIVCSPIDPEPKPVYPEQVQKIIGYWVGELPRVYSFPAPLLAERIKETIAVIKHAATPSSAGMVSVEEAEQVARDCARRYEQVANYTKAEACRFVASQIAALRALAGEGGR